MYSGKINGTAADKFINYEIGIILFEEFDCINCKPNDIQTQKPDSIFIKVLTYLAIQEENKPYKKYPLNLNFESRKVKKTQTFDFSEIAQSPKGLLGSVPISFSNKKQRIIILSLEQIYDFLRSLRSPCINEILSDPKLALSIDIVMLALEKQFTDEPINVRAQMIDMLRRIKQTSLPLKYQRSLLRKKSSKRQKITNEQPINNTASAAPENEQVASIASTSSIDNISATQVEIESEEDIVFLMANEKTEEMLSTLEKVVNDYNTQGRSHSLFKKHAERDVQIKRLANFITESKQDISNSDFDKTKNRLLKIVCSALLRTVQTHRPHGIGHLKTTSRLANYLANYKDKLTDIYDPSEISAAEAFAIAYNQYINTVNSILDYFNKQSKRQNSCFSFLNSQHYETVKSQTQIECEDSLAASPQQFATDWFQHQTARLKEKLREENPLVYDQLFIKYEDTHEHDPLLRKNEGLTIS